MKKVIVVIAAALLCGCIFDDFQFVDSKARAYYQQRGFEIAGYQGYNMWVIGRCYWYTIRRGEITYESCLLKWGDEVHEYSLHAIDAIKP